MSQGYFFWLKIQAYLNNLIRYWYSNEWYNLSLIISLKYLNKHIGNK